MPYTGWVLKYINNPPNCINSHFVELLWQLLWLLAPVEDLDKEASSLVLHPGHLLAAGAELPL